MRVVNALFVISLLAVSVFTHAQPMNVDEVPSQLTDWVDWVLYDEAKIGCPYRYDEDSRACAWPSRLQLRLNDEGGQFTQRWQLYNESFIRLPGGAEHWPLNVSSQNGTLLIQSYDDEPYVKLPAGEHVISGQFKWIKLPKSLTITPDSGLVDLQVNGHVVEQPEFGDEGKLWLLQTDNQQVSKDNIDLQVFRRIVDGHPIKVETLIKLRISGKQRNVNLSSVLLDDFIAIALDSDLPVRLEGNNQLKVQLRPGEWTISVTGRAPADLQQFTMPNVSEAWPQQEVWVFVSDNNMRQVQVSGVTSIDPSQTRLPQEWRGLPAYLLSPEQTLSLDVQDRGVADLAQNDLRLHREMWLDFDGGGYSIKDQLTGQLQQSRVNVLPRLELGRVSINQQPQFITRETGKEFAGVEVRQSALNLAAESRYIDHYSLLPVNGWQLDFQQVDTRLHLPPGWRVLTVTGADNVPNTWVQKWSLLDLFLVMIIVMSIRHFYGWRWAGFSLVTLVLVWQESGAPTLIWLNLLAVTALLSVLKENRFTKIVRSYRWATLAVFAIIFLSYMIEGIRVSIYPQLERGYTQQWGEVGRAQSAGYGLSKLESKMSEAVLEDSSVLEEIVVVGSKGVSKVRQTRSVNQQARKKIDLKVIDPNSLIQSGPGLPSWTGYQSISLQWSGPVKANQTSRIVLLSPIMNSIIKLLGIILLLVLVWRFVCNDDESSNMLPSRNWLKFFKPASVAVLLCLILPAVDPANTANAQSIPDEDILYTLQERLTKSPECVGSCAQIEQMKITVSAQQLQARLRVHALTDVSIPLPGSQATWLPKQVLVNSKSAVALARDGDGLLWLSVPKGLHDIVLSGGLSKRISLPLPLPLTPKFISWESDDGSWTLDGINDNGVASAQLQLTRVLNKENQQSFQVQSNTLPSFVKVSRQLQLGLDWYVHTTVSRISPEATPLNVTVSLLANEQILNAKLVVKDQQVTLNFTANQASVSWSSKLDSTSDIVLMASNSADYLEVWSIDASPVWHVESTGLPVNRYLKGEQQNVVPIWQPWPGEQLNLNIDRPAGVTGQALTIQGSQLVVGAGKRVNDVALTLAIRSSRGTQHSIELSPDADIQQLTIDGAEQRIQRNENKLSLTLKPGKQEVLINWREPSAQKVHYKFPSVNLGLPSVNAHAAINLPRSRWVLWANGPTLGPAVLFWGVLLALLVFSIVLGFSKLTPLTTVNWFLLAIGLSQTLPVLIIVVVACFIGLSMRERLKLTSKRWQFNMMQIALMVLIFVSVSIMVGAVANGLLGSPDMQIAGNGSSSHYLKWYQDRVVEGLPQPQIISVPMWIYRVLMLAWAMWLATSLLKWTQWGWQALNVGGFWRKKTVIATTNESSGASD